MNRKSHKQLWLFLSAQCLLRWLGVGNRSRDDLPGVIFLCPDSHELELVFPLWAFIRAITCHDCCDVMFYDLHVAHFNGAEFRTRTRTVRRDDFFLRESRLSIGYYDCVICQHALEKFWVRT